MPTEDKPLTLLKNGYEVWEKLKEEGGIRRMDHIVLYEKRKINSHRDGRNKS